MFLSISSLITFVHVSLGGKKGCASPSPLSDLNNFFAVSLLPPFVWERGGVCHYKLVHFNPMFFVVFDPSTLTAPSGVAGGVAKRGGGV